MAISKFKFIAFGSKESPTLRRTDSRCIDPKIRKKPGLYIIRYHDNEMSPKDREAFEAHMKNCEYCRIGYGNFRNIVSALRRAYKKARERAQ